MSISSAITSIRASVAELGISKFQLARGAGLSENACRDLDNDGWNPKADTLKRIEDYIATERARRNADATEAA